MSASADSSARTQSSPSYMVRPLAAVLWDGVPLEELGIADALLSSQFTATVGRTKPSKRYKAGKPKVGGAQLEFSLESHEIAQRLARLLHVNHRPTIALGYGYEGTPGYWVGGAAAGNNLDTKKYKRIGAFKMDKTTWKYGANSMPKLTMVGVTDKAVSMVEKMSPRVYTETTIKKIMEGIADEHGLILDIDPSLPVEQRLSGIIKTNQESDWDFFGRLAERVGAASMWLETHEAAFGEIGATNSSTRFTYKDPTGEATAADLTSKVRNILHISRLSSFLDLKQLTQVKPTVIGYGAFLTTEQKAQCDYLATNVTIADSGYKSGAVPSTAKQEKDDSLKQLVLGGGDLRSSYAVKVKIGEQFQTTLDGTNKAETQRIRNTGEIPGTQVMHEVTSVLPAEVDPSGICGSAQLAAMALVLGFTFEISIELSPGVPYIQPPTQLNLVGTDAHDGLYGVEEATQKYDGKGGLGSILRCKPIDVPNQNAKKKPNDAGLSRVTLGGGDSGSSFAVNVDLNGKGFLEATETKTPAPPKLRTPPEAAPAGP